PALRQAHRAPRDPLTAVSARGRHPDRGGGLRHTPAGGRTHGPSPGHPHGRAPLPTDGPAASTDTRLASMPVNPDYAGREYPPAGPFPVTREEIVAFADALGSSSAAHREVDPARALG